MGVSLTGQKLPNFQRRSLADPHVALNSGIKARAGAKALFALALVLIVVPVKLLSC